MTPFLPFLFAAALSAAPAQAPVTGSGCKTTDLMPAFWSFWEKARGQSAAGQYRLFEEIVRQPNAPVYEGAFHGFTKPPAEFIPRSLDGVPSIEAAMRELSGRLATDLPGELAAFQKAFPRFQCSTPVFFLYSAGAFDGATRDVEGKPALMFGVDVIARLAEKLSPLVVHELFHVYHHQAVAEDPETFGWALWAEGLATYVSRRLNPDLPEQEVCCLPRIAPVEAVLPRLAAEALQLLDSEKSEDYRRYFLGGAELDIPSRSGYYLGYRIASGAAKTRTLEELAALTPPQVRELEVVHLQRMSGVAPERPRSKEPP